MKIIDRYIGISVIATAFFGVVVLSLVLVLGNLFKQLLDVLINNPDVPIATVLAFMALVLPFSLTFTIPWGFLTALLLVFGRISADNELVALKSNGVSVPRICIPVFVLAVLLSAVCFWINIEVAPRAEQQMTKTIVDIATSNPAALFRADQVVDQFPDRRVYVGAKDGDRLKNLIVFELNENNEPIKMVYAREGVLTPDPANTRLLLRLFNARFEERDKQDPRDLTKIRQGIEVNEGVFPISLEEFYKEYLSGRRLSSYTLPELINYLKGLVWAGAIEGNRRTSQALCLLARLRGLRVDRNPSWHYSPPQGNIRRLRTEPNHRFHLLLLHHHGGHVPRRCGGASDHSDLGSQHTFYDPWELPLLAAFEKISKNRLAQDPVS